MSTANQKARRNAWEWAVKIAKDNKYHYGRSKWAHHSGCPFCNTQGTKKKLAPKSQWDEVKYSYCCNPFVTAAYHHGAGAKSVDCKVKNKRINLANDPNPVFKTSEWKRISKPKKCSDLKVGDVLLTPTHCMITDGEGNVAHAKHHDNGVKNDYWNSSIKVEKIPAKQWKRTTKIYRYVGKGKFKDDRPSLEKPIFPMKNLRITATPTSFKAHINCSKGKPADYPTDWGGKDSGKDWVYAPCKLVCLRVYGKASHAIWFRSYDKVTLPNGKNAYLYMMLEHMSISGYKAGKIIKKGDKLFTENTYGGVASHIHASFGYSTTKHTSKTMGTGWRKNTKGAWVLHIPKVTNAKIQDVLFVSKSFTKIKDTKGIKFKEIK